MNEAKTWVEISKKALTDNVRAFRRHVGKGTGVMAVVKSNAYGHGLVGVAKHVARDVGWFGVDNVDEGIALRKSGITKPILILGYTPQARLQECIAHDLSFVIYNIETARALAKLKRSRPAYVHIKIETGTTRQGVAGAELQKLARALKKIPHVVIEGCSTHFANIEDTADHSYAELQLQRFREGLAILAKEGIDPPWKHAACSAAAVLFPDTYFNLVRIGISMYGLWSVPAKKSSLVLKPALAWKTVVAQVKQVPKGTPVSYGLTERVTRNSRLAVIPVGYWDGFDRGLSGCATVLVRGRHCKVVGRVCMNMCVVDVTDVPGVKVEDEVVLIGAQGREHASVEDMAKLAKTINYEVVTRINPQIQRILV